MDRYKVTLEHHTERNATITPIIITHQQYMEIMKIVHKKEN